MLTENIPSDWEKWCATGNHGKRRKRNAVLKCLKLGCVRGYFSDIVLDPTLPYSHSMSPSIEHLNGRDNHQETAVEARVINDMKSHLSEEEFWEVIQHLFAVGVQKGKITSPTGKLLRTGWSPNRHF